MTHSLFRRELSGNPEARRCDAVVMIGDLATVPVPYFVYYDTSHDAFISATQGPDVYAAMKLIASVDLDTPSRAATLDL